MIDFGNSMESEWGWVVSRAPGVLTSLFSSSPAHICLSLTLRINFCRCSAKMGGAIMHQMRIDYQRRKPRKIVFSPNGTNYVASRKFFLRGSSPQGAVLVHTHRVEGLGRASDSDSLETRRRRSQC